MPQKILGMFDFESRVRSTFQMVKLCKMSSEQENELVAKDIYAELHRKHGKRAVYSQYMRGFVFGLMVAERERIMREMVEFCYLVDGTLYSTHNDSDKPKTEFFYAQGKGCILSDSPCAHVWKGSDKPYTRLQRISDRKTQAEQKE